MSFIYLPVDNICYSITLGSFIQSNFHTRFSLVLSTFPQLHLSILKKDQSQMNRMRLKKGENEPVRTQSQQVPLPDERLHLLCYQTDQAQSSLSSTFQSYAPGLCCLHILEAGQCRIDGCRCQQHLLPVILYNNELPSKKKQVKNITIYMKVQELLHDPNIKTAISFFVSPEILLLSKISQSASRFSNLCPSMIH